MKPGYLRNLNKNKTLVYDNFVWDNALYMLALFSLSCLVAVFGYELIALDLSNCTVVAINAVIFHSIIIGLFYFIYIIIRSIIINVLYILNNNSSSLHLFPKTWAAIQSTCIHGHATVAACAICSLMTPQRLVSIAGCTHDWRQWNYDNYAVRNSNCDFVAPGDVASDTFHHAINNMGDIAYTCSDCMAVCCSVCFAG